MSYTASAFQALIATHLNRVDLTSQIATFCAMAVQELEEHCFWFQLTSATVSTANATDYTALPTGFIREVKDGLRDTAGKRLLKETWEQVDHWEHYSEGVGLPRYYAIADKIYWYPIPNAVYAMPVLYYQSLGFPTSTANAWTDQLWDLTFFTTMGQAWFYLGNIAEQQKCEAQKAVLLARYKSRSGKLTGRGTVRYKEF